MAEIYYFTFTYFISLLVFLNNRPQLVFILPILVLYLLIGIFTLIKKKNPLNQTLYIALGGIIWGAFVPSLYKPEPATPEIREEQIIFDGYIKESPIYKRDSTVFQVEVQRYITGEKLYVKRFSIQYISSVPLASPLRGDLIRAVCRIHRGDDGRLICTGRAGEPPLIIERKEFSILNSIDEYKKGISEFIFSKFRGDISGILIALSTGNSKELSYDVRRVFAQSGTSHILAISGTHIGLISILIYYLLKVLLLPLAYIRPFSIRKLSSFFLIIILVFISFYFGNSPSVVRAVTMICVYLLSIIIERERDTPASLCFAFVLITSFSPDAITDIGFQLSFLSVLGIITFVPSFAKTGYETGASVLYYAINSIKILLITSLAAMLFTLPAVAYHFGIISLVGLFSNVILVPFAGLITLPLTVLGVSAYGISQSLSLFFLKGAFVSLEHFYFLNSLFAAVPLSHVKIFRPSYGEIVLFYITIASLVLRKRIPYPKITFATLVLLFFLYSLIADRVEKNRREPLMLIRGGVTVIIDSGGDTHIVADRYTTNNDKRRAVNFLHKKRIVRVLYTNAGLQDDTYIKDHLYTTEKSENVSKTEGGDILINFSGYFVFIYNDISSCPPLAARYVISRRTSEESVARIFECGIRADRLIFSGGTRNPGLYKTLSAYYGKDADNIIICRDEDCEILIQPEK
ncbi:MAG: ComEC/Rec2 family competence protein [Deltaproteobacteria bacterium]|nr:ComEC/Rec2 family competence protein [Deltaproteobacteria bacterium]